jgi:hypothetical protein
MAEDLRIDLSELRRTWQLRRALAADVHRRIDPAGMTRPPRTKEERQWLAERGITSPFNEVEENAEAYRAYFRAKYGGP